MSQHWISPNLGMYQNFAGTALFRGCPKFGKLLLREFIEEIFLQEKLKLEMSQNWTTPIWECPKSRKTQFGNVPKSEQAYLGAILK